ncbi:MAG: YqjF family protein [Acidimicrobiales bacterium]
MTSSGISEQGSGSNGVRHQPIGPICPEQVDRLAMFHRWDLLTFLHWSYDPAVVQRLLPPGLSVETFEDRAWVGLVPFQMEVRAPRGPALPWISHFCETNVRTYVTASDGTRGVWFFSLDAARLAAVVTARTTYRLPYFWSEMSLSQAGSTMTYACRRRWPGARNVSSRVQIRIGERFGPDELTERDHYLTARWRLYSHQRRGLRAAIAFHEPWTLHRAEVVQLDDELFTAAGLPDPHGDPIVHWSPGVEVRIGLPHGVAFT